MLTADPSGREKRSAFSPKRKASYLTGVEAWFFIWTCTTTHPQTHRNWTKSSCFYAYNHRPTRPQTALPGRNTTEETNWWASMRFAMWINVTAWLITQNVYLSLLVSLLVCVSNPANVCVCVYNLVNVCLCLYTTLSVCPWDNPNHFRPCSRHEFHLYQACRLIFIWVPFKPRPVSATCLVKALCRCPESVMVCWGR